MNQLTIARANSALAEPQPPIAAELIVARLLDGDDLDADSAELLFAELVEGRLVRAADGRGLRRPSPEGRDRGGADRRGARASRRGAPVPASRLSLRRQLRHRRRLLGVDQRVDRRRPRRRRVRAFPWSSTATAASPRNAARPTCSRRSARGSTSPPSGRGGCSTRPASASCSRRPITRGSRMPGRFAARSRCARS